MAADEQQTQHVVAIAGIIEAFGEIGFGIVEIRYELIGRQGLALAAPARIVEGDIAADQDQPGSGIARRSVDRPVLEGAQAGFLIRLLGLIEIAEIAQQRANRLGPGGAQRGIDPIEIVHRPATPGLRLRTGRTSKAPDSLWPIWRAVAMASSRVGQSTM